VLFSGIKTSNDLASRKRLAIDRRAMQIGRFTQRYEARRAIWQLLDAKSIKWEVSFSF